MYKGRGIFRLIVLLVMLFIAVKFYYRKVDLEIPNDFISIKTIAIENIKEKKGKRTNFGYSIVTKESNTMYTIDNCVNFVCDREKLKAIKIGDTVNIIISEFDIDAFSDVGIQVPIYGLDLNGRTLFSTEDYLEGMEKQHKRTTNILVSIFFILMAFELFEFMKYKKKHQIIY